MVAEVQPTREQQGRDELDRPVDPPARGRGRLAGLVAVVLPTVAIGVHGSLYGRWVVDDAAITFAYARSVATGAGPVLQAGAPAVEGYSNPAWLALLVLGRWLGLFDHGAWFGVPDYVLFPKVLALLCCAGVLASMLVVARRLTTRPALVTTVAGLALAAVPSFVIWVVSGLENPLLALAVTALAAVLVSAHAGGRLLEPRTALLCGALASLATLTRPDGAIHLAAYPLVVIALVGLRHLGPTARAAGVYAAAVAVPVGAYLLFRWTTFGLLVPNTAVAKSQDLPTLATLERPLELVTSTGLVTAVLVVGLLAAGLARRGPGRETFAVLLVPLVLAVAAFAVLAPDWMGQLRFATPVWPLAATSATVAAARLLGPAGVRARVAAVAVGLVAALTAGTGFADAATSFRAQPTLWTCAVVGSVGVVPNRAAEAAGVTGGTLAVPDVGGAALTSDLRIVDLAGLVDAEIAQYWRTGDMAGLRDHLLDDVRPTFVLTHDPWSSITGLTTDPRLAADYAVVQRDPTGAPYLLVRRDVVDGQAGVDRVTAAVDAALVDVGSRPSGPRASCGDTLPVGKR